MKIQKVKCSNNLSLTTAVATWAEFAGPMIIAGHYELCLESGGVKDREGNLWEIPGGVMTVGEFAQWHGTVEAHRAEVLATDDLQARVYQHMN